MPTRHAGVVVEFKTVSKKQTPEEALAAARAQILEKKYVVELEAHCCKRISQWAIAFRGKEVF
ncbi:MAG: PD-(D/E)XK nuclease domain-containing protein [Pseudomonadota bacterium]